MSFFTRRRSSWTSCWSSDALRSVTSRLTATFVALPSHPRAVERGTPRSVGMVTSPVPRTTSEAGGRSAAEGAQSWSWDDHRPFADAPQLLEGIAGCPPTCNGPPL